jgi:hypothetical protein
MYDPALTSAVIVPITWRNPQSHGRLTDGDGVADARATLIAGYYAKSSMNSSLRVDRGDAKQTRRHQGQQNYEISEKVLANG